MVRSSISHHSQVTLIKFLLQSHILTLLFSNLQFDLLRFHSCNIVYFIYRAFALMSDSITIIKKKNENVDWKHCFNVLASIDFPEITSRRWIWVITTNHIVTYIVRIWFNMYQSWMIVYDDKRYRHIIVRIWFNVPIIVFDDERYRHIYGSNIIQCTNVSFRLLKLDTATSAQRVNAHALLEFIILSRNKA